QRQRARRAGLPVARFRRVARALGRRLARDPARRAGLDRIPRRRPGVMALHDAQLVGGDALLGDIPGLARPADADAFSLPDRIEGKTDVLAERRSVLIDDRAGRLRQITIQELAERALADEANPGRVLLGVVRQSGFLGHAAHLRLLEIA